MNTGQLSARQRAIATVSVLFSVLLAPAPASANKFVAAWIFPTSTYSTTPTEATGDFNGDGKPDLIFPYYYSSTQVAVLLGNGDGTFQGPLVSTGAGAFPKWVAVGDFNGDGKLDVVLADYGDHTSGGITVMLGNGNGTFQPGTQFTAGTNPYMVVVGDFNNDGKLDVAALNSSGSAVSILLGNGDGTLQTATNYSVSGGPAWLATGDFNGDGKLDLVTANGGSRNVTVLLGNGDGTFQAGENTYNGLELTTVAVADLNEDGKADLALLGYGSSSLQVMLGNGDGTFQAPSSFNVVASGGLAIADVNRDGNLDLVVGNNEYDGSPNPASLSVLLGNGDGTFQPALGFSTSSEVEAVVLADFNLDGNQDIAGLNQSTVSVGVVFGRGDGTFTSAPTYSVSGRPGSGLSADFNNDGIPDLAFTDNGGVAILLGQAGGTFQPSKNASVTGPVSVATGDFNGDGKLDLVCATGEVAVLLGNGDGTFGAASYYVADSGAQAVAVGDVNGDGKLDIVAVNFSSADISVLLGNGDGTFRTAVNYNEGGVGLDSLVLADFNGDHNLDVALANDGNGGKGTLSVMLGNGDGSFGTATQYAQNGYPGSIMTGDVNGDGKLDLVVAEDNATIGVLLGKGDGTFKSTVYFPVGIAPTSVALADFNGDAKLDVAVGDYFGNVNVLHGTGNGSFLAPIIYGAGSEPGYVAAGDFNLDGAPDLAAANVLSDDLSVLLNTGGTFITTTSSPNPSSPGQPVTFTATVSASIGGTGSPTGSVTFYDGTTALGTVPLTSGTATFITSTLTLGTHTIAAAYLGDSNFNPHTGSPITQNVVNGAVAVLSPTSLIFGNQNVGSTSAPQNVTLTNTGTATLSITSIATTGDFGQTNNCGSSLGVGANCTIMVTFTPAATGTRTGSLLVTDNAPGSPQSVSLTGTGTQPLVSISPASLTFPTQLIFTSSRPQTATLTNNGTGALTISGISVTGNFSQTNTCGTTVAVGASCQISVTFRPAGEGTLTGAVLITDNAPGSPQSLTLTGTGTVVLLSATSINFGSVPVGHTSGPNTLTLSNTVNQSLTIQSIGITGTNSGDFAETNTCGTSVPPRGSCSISVSFTPHAKGPRSAAISIRDNGGGSPQTVSLSGAGE